MTRWISGAVLAAVGFLAITGCSEPVQNHSANSTATSSSAPPPQIYATTAFGDARTVDPCSIVDVAAFDGTLLTPDALDTCQVSAKLPDGTATQVDIGPLARRGQSNTRTERLLPDGMAVLQDGQPGGGYCGDYIAFADEYVLDVTANPNPHGKNVCPIADAVATSVATRITQGAIRHRTYPPGSVGLVDPCGLIPNNTLTAAGLINPSATHYLEQHECDWFSPNNITPTVELHFIVVARSSLSSDASTHIAGRPTSIDPGDQSCFADTELNTYGENGNLVEAAEIWVEDKNGGTAEAICNTAETLAAAVWPRLPSTKP